MSNSKQVVLSYAREDFEDAVRVYRALTEFGIEVWFDKVSLLPGQNWRIAVSEAIRRTGFFVALLSSRSIEKRGFVQAETRKALDVLSEIPPSDTYIIPVRLEPCAPQHEILHDLQWVDLFDDWGVGLRSIRQSILKSGSERPPIQVSSSFLLPPVLRFDGVYIHPVQTTDSVALRFFPNGSVVLKASFGVTVRYEELSQALAGGDSTILRYKLERGTIAFGDRGLLQTEYTGSIQERSINFHQINPVPRFKHLLGADYVFKPFT